MIHNELIPKIKMVAPGTILRRALDAILMADFGALIVFLDDIKAQEDILQGGFYIGASFSPEKLYELAKMDGAIILDGSVSRILAANVQLAPDARLPTNETGMRHRAAERMARQTGKFVLTISRRRRVITLYHHHHKHQIREISYLFARIDQTIGTVERNKANIDNQVLRIEGDEIQDQVTLIQVVALIRDSLEIMNLLEEIAPDVIETGDQGRLSELRLNNVREEIETLTHLFVKDYSRQKCSDKDADRMIAGLQAAMPAEPARIARDLGWTAAGESDLQDLPVRPRGYRLLMLTANIPPGTAENVIGRFKDLLSLSRAGEASLMQVEGVGAKRAQSILKGIRLMRGRSRERTAGHGPGQ